MRLSVTAVLQLLIATASWSMLVMIVAGFGSVATRVTDRLRVIIFVLLPAVGLANAAATLSGRPWAGKAGSCRKIGLDAGFLNAGLLDSRAFLVFSGPGRWHFYY